MTTSDALAEFLLARYAEDEAAAREPWLRVLSDVQAWWDAGEDEPGWFADDQPDDVKGLAKTLIQIERRRGTYARELADVEANRRIVALHGEAVEVGLPGEEDLHTGECRACGERVPCCTLRALALPHADHPDYREEWKP